MIRGTVIEGECAVVVVVIRGTEKECAVSVVANRAIKEAVMKDSVGRCNIIIIIFFIA
jgi:metal-sulfur cluster biosynthetic enzyme